MTENGWNPHANGENGNHAGRSDDEEDKKSDKDGGDNRSDSVKDFLSLMKANPVGTSLNPEDSYSGNNKEHDKSGENGAARASYTQCR